MWLISLKICKFADRYARRRILDDDRGSLVYVVRTASEVKTLFLVFGPYLKNIIASKHFLTPTITSLSLHFETLIVCLSFKAL